MGKIKQLLQEENIRRSWEQSQQISDDDLEVLFERYHQECLANFPTITYNDIEWVYDESLQEIRQVDNYQESISFAYIPEKELSLIRQTISHGE